MKQKCRFEHPLNGTFFEADIPVEMTFKEIQKYLMGEGFITEKKGGYQFIFEDRICKLGAALETYIPEGTECMEIRIHGLLIILT